LQESERLVTDRERRELIEQLQAIIQPKLDDPWIMESPDGGNTVTKRRGGQTEEKFVLSKQNGRWYNHKEAVQIAVQLDREAELREQHPGLKEAYEVYRTMLAIIEPDMSKDRVSKG